MNNRWWIYQRERFPVLVHGPVIAVFGASSVCYSRLLRGGSGWPDLHTVGTACTCTLLFFFQLRVADEWKDYGDDLRFRPYRAVPRGLVTLPELRTMAIVSALIQLLLSLWLGAVLLPLLFAVWAYMILMTKEFFAAAWLKAHPVAYLLSHMLIMPLIYLYASGCDWRVAGYIRWSSLAWFLACGFFNGMVFEFGRKIRAPQDEESGVETYTALWGRKRALGAWAAAIGLSAGAALVAAHGIPLNALRFALSAAIMLTAVSASLRFASAPVRAGAKAIETISGIWTLLLLLSLGPLPLLATL